MKLIMKSNRMGGQNVPTPESLAAAVQLQWKVLP